MNILDKLEQLEKKSTQGKLTLTRYPLGGGRFFKDGESGEMKLVADFYDEEDREYIVALHNNAKALIEAVRVAEEALKEVLKLAPVCPDDAEEALIANTAIKKINELLGAEKD